MQVLCRPDMNGTHDDDGQPQANSNELMGKLNPIYDSTLPPGMSQQVWMCGCVYVCVCVCVCTCTAVRSEVAIFRKSTPAIATDRN